MRKLGGYAQSLLYPNKKYKKSYPRTIQAKRYQRRTKLIRNPDTLFTKIEVVQTIGYVSGGNVLSFQGGANYQNHVFVLTNSLSWTDIYAFWQRYKITGMALRVGRIFNENSITSQLSNESPNPLYIASYPNLTSGNAANNPLYNDKSFRVDPYVTGIQSHYWKFPDGFLDVTQGIGINNQNNLYANQVGQISIYSEPLANNASAAVNCFEIRTCLYVTMKDRND